MNYLLSTTEIWRVPDMEAADALEESLRDQPEYNILKFNKTQKNKKVQGEIVEEWVRVSVTREFNLEREPENIVSLNYVCS